MIEDIEQGRESGERYYRIKYSDGGLQHLTAIQVTESIMAEYFPEEVEDAPVPVSWFKCVRPTLMHDSFVIKNAKSLRKVDLGETIGCLEYPAADEPEFCLTRKRGGPKEMGWKAG